MQIKFKDYDPLLHELPIALVSLRGADIVTITPAFKVKPFDPPAQDAMGFVLAEAAAGEGVFVGIQGVINDPDTLIIVRERT